MTTTAEHLATFRRFAAMPAPATEADTLGIEDRSPGLVDLGRATVVAEALPFARLVVDLDAYFDGEPDSALAGPEVAEAEAQARRVIAGHLASASMRLALSAAAGSAVAWIAADVATLQQLAGVALQRAADLRFVEAVSPAVKAA